MADQSTTTGPPMFTYDRGWNDPPKRVFAPVATNRKRIDPRKRVGHDLTSSHVQVQQAYAQPPGVQQPGNGFPPQRYPPSGHMPTNLQPNMNMGPPSGHAGFLTPPLLGNSGGHALGGGIQHASSNPDIHRTAELPPMVQPNSMPYNLHPNGPLSQPSQPTGTFLPVSPPKSLEAVTPPPPISPTPLAINPAPVPPSLTPPGHRDNRKLMSPTNRLPNDSIFNQMGTPTMLHSATKTQNKAEIVPPSVPTPAAITQPVAPVPNVMLPPPIATFGGSSVKPAVPPANLQQPPPQLLLHTLPTPQQHQPQTNVAPPIHQQSAVAPPMQQQPAVAPPPMQQQPAVAPPPMQQQPAVAPPPMQPQLAGLPQMLQEPQGVPSPLVCNTSPTPPQQSNLSAPPTNGYYRSPQGSGPNSPIPSKKGENSEMSSEDVAAADGVVEQLLNCLNKCSCVITNKNSEDISKKVHLLKTAWCSGKLSPTVREQMGVLSSALDRGELGPADAVHKSLVASHSGEVMSWMIGIKKLISSYQKVLDTSN